MTGDAQKEPGHYDWFSHTLTSEYWLTYFLCYLYFTYHANGTYTQYDVCVLCINAFSCFWLYIDFIVCYRVYINVRGDYGTHT